MHNGCLGPSSPGLHIHAQRRAERQRAERGSKRKQERPNYKSMDNPSYVLVHSVDWYTEGDQDFELDDQSFWCAAQEGIYKDIYEKARKPIRPMSATD